MAYTKSVTQIVWEVSLTLHVVLCFGYGLATLWYGRTFYKKRDSNAIKKRYSKIVMVINVLAMIMLFLTWPYSDIQKLTHIDDADHSSKLSVTIVFVLTYPFCAYGIVTFNSLRYYMIYYEANFLLCSNNLQWKTYINSALKTLKKENWYISHRDTLGNEKSMMRATAIFVCAAATISSALRILGYYVYASNTSYLHGADFYDAFFFTLPLIVSIFIFCKTPEFSDSIFIHQEMKFLIAVYAVGLLLYIISIVVDVSSTAEWAKIIGYVLPLYIGGTCLWLLGFVSTYWVLRQIRRMHGDGDDDEYRAQESDDYMHSVHTTSNYERLTLRVILLDQHLYNLFMMHLMTEFSMECLLAFTEFLQYKQVAHQAFGLQSFDEHGVVALSETVPKSAIVYDNYNADTLLSPQESQEEQEPETPNLAMDRSDVTSSVLGVDENEQIKINMFKIKAAQLFSKYVKVGAQFEINVSYGARYKCITLMQDKARWMNEDNKISPDELCNVFSGCQNQIYLLMNDSLTRFKTTDLFRKYVESQKEYQQLIKNEEV